MWGRMSIEQSIGTGQELYLAAKQLIPGGTQLLSKRPEMFLPDQWPSYYSRAKGCEVWDLDGRRFIDMTSSGIGSCLLGFADDNWVDGTQTHVFMFDTPEDRALGYGFTTTAIHEFGHHIGMSHPHDGYDSARERAATLRDRGQQTVESTQNYVQDEPIKSLLIAAAVGAAVIALVEVVRIRRNR